MNPVADVSLVGISLQTAIAGVTKIEAYELLEGLYRECRRVSDESSR